MGVRTHSRGVAIACQTRVNSVRSGGWGLGVGRVLSAEWDGLRASAGPRLLDRQHSKRGPIGVTPIDPHYQCIIARAVERKVD